MEEVKKIGLQFEEGTMTSKDGEKREFCTLFVALKDEETDECININFKPKNSSVANVLKGRMKAGLDVDIVCSGEREYTDKKTREKKKTRDFLVLLPFNGVVRKVEMQIASGQKMLNGSINSTFERNLLLEFMGFVPPPEDYVVDDGDMPY